MTPSYLKLLTENELEERVEPLESMLAACNICPKDCGNDRINDEIAACYSGRLPIVSSYTAHFGEEPLCRDKRARATSSSATAISAASIARTIRSRKPGESKKRTRSPTNGSPR